MCATARRFALTLVALVATVVLASACGGAGKVEVEPVQETPDVEEVPEWVAARIANEDGNFHAVLFGTADHGVGSNRVSFVVMRRNDNSIVQAPKADVYFGLKTSKNAMEAEATLVPLGPHRHPRRTEPHDHPDATDIYVTTVRFPRPGEYWFVVQPKGPGPLPGAAEGPTGVAGAGLLEVAKRQVTPAVGSRAIPSDNPTLADAPAKAITTGRPPKTELLRYSVADSLRDHVPFVVVFATPALCQSRVCGPTLDVVDKVRKRLTGKGVRFIHIEVYTDNQPAKGFNRWLREWRLPTEPWVFLVDEMGVIRAKFEGAVSVDELERAVWKHLL
jgi:hypothetical protein